MTGLDILNLLKGHSQNLVQTKKQSVAGVFKKVLLVRRNLFY